ncbi:hypothetical protein [Chondromyces apiculatus]|uniref:Uncharacterized protein n=1 Tax=Chondromyces apiculatus DSM 436 TaxID=1192034 RepID=A0A017SXT2_9BACT|nr:hypothetical protein [Chondromyces apiculatus]EYF01537.1 Hypothetical protein CAP_8098 [Chondromyces apiculatus DSM 436]
MVRPAFRLLAALGFLAACGSPPPAEAPDATPPAEPPPPAAPAPAEEPAPAAEKVPETPAAPAEAAPSDAEVLARDFLKTGGRRIGYSATKKGFAYPLEQRKEDGFRLDILFTDEEGRKRDVMTVCDYAVCVERLDEIAKELLPKLAARLQDDGYASIRGIGWPSGRDELEVNLIGMKLKYTSGRLEGLREGKPPLTLGRLGTKAPELLAVFVVPDVKRLGVLAKPADGKGVVQELHIVKLP